MCGCCVNLWPGLSGGPRWRGVKVKGKWEVGPVCGKHLTGARSPRLGPQKPDSSRRLLEGRRCCVWSLEEPLVPTLSVPIPLSCPAGGTEGQLMLVMAPMLEEKQHKSEHPLSFTLFYFYILPFLLLTLYLLFPHTYLCSQYSTLNSYSFSFVLSVRKSKDYPLTR